MRLLLGALMIALAIAAALNLPEQIRNADRRGGHRMVELSAVAAWPAFDRTPSAGLIRRRSSGRSMANGSRRGDD